MSRHKSINLAGLNNKTLRASLLTIFLLILPLYNNLVSSQLHQDDSTASPLSSFLLSSGGNSPTAEIDTDGFTIDESLSDSLADQFFAKEELLKESEELHDGGSSSSSSSSPSTGDHHDQAKPVFSKICPYGFFQCQNGECVSPKWRCDGHYDCDDYSDEFNCTSVDPDNHKSGTDSVPLKPPPPPPKPTGTYNDDSSELTFNSTEEPLLLCSTGLTIRGFWMKKRIYFDIVSMGVRPPKVEIPAITQAFSVFFDIFNLGDRPLTSPVTSSSPSSKQIDQGTSDTTSVRSRSTIVGVDMDSDTKEVFWVELGKNAGVFSTIIEDEQFVSRHRRQLINKNKVYVDAGLLSPEDIALDGIGKNFYVTDAGLPAIVVCTMKHSHCQMIIRDIHKPRAIIADSTTGWLTYTDWGDHPGIYLVTMDGKKRETLIDTEVVWPNGLAPDYQTNQLYWADARLSKIERVDLATRKRTVLLQEKDANPFSLSLFENRIYWSDWQGNNIKTCDKNYGNDTKELMHAENVYGIHIYHSSLYNRVELHSISNPCWSKHCTHLCLLSPSGTNPTYANRKSGSIQGTCACPDSMALSAKDKSTCYEVNISFLLINVKNYIAQVFPDRIGLHVVDKIIYSKEHIIHDVASDWLHYRMFFFDAAKQHIYLADLSDKNFKIESFMPTSQSVRGLLYDTWSDNLYWLDSDRGTMSLCSVKGKFETVIRKDLERPISMVLDSKQRVFYIAMLGSMPHIMRTDIYGNEQSDVIVIGSDIGLPVALHLDEKLQRLYWADARRESIESLDLDINAQGGIKPNSRLIHRRKLGTILAFSVYEDHFLWTIKNGDYLYKARIPPSSSNDGGHQMGTAATSAKLGEEIKPVTFRLPPNPSAKDPSSDNKRIILVDPKSDLENIHSPCHKRGCSHGCVLDSSHTAVCVCPEA